MKQKNYQRWSRPLLLTLLSIFMAFSGASSAWAETATFENSLPEGWTQTGSNLSYVQDARAHNGDYGLSATYQSDGGWTTRKNNYLVTTEIEGTVTFWMRSYNTGKDCNVVFYKYDSETTFGDKIQEFTMASTTWAQKTVTLSEAGQVVIAINYACIDDMVYTPHVQSSGPGFAVKDGSTKLSSPYAYSFGLTTSGSTKTFKLTNPGTAATPISVDVSGANGFTAAVEDNATSIPAGGEKTLTITMPNATASGSVVVTPTGDGLSAFTFNVSGTVRDPNKVYLDFSDGNMPDGWTAVGYSSYYSTYDWTVSTGYISYSATSSSAAGTFTSPKLNFTNGEEVFFETAKYGDSGYSSPSITVEYTTDATGDTGWKTIGSAFTDDTYGNWTSRSVTIPEEGVKRIRFKGWYIHMRNIYGGEEPNEPKMVVTQPATLDFGLYDKDADPAPTKTFTIANTGKATLSGISVTSGNAAFTITGAPTSLAAGASETVTITMSTATTGALSSLITVSATDMEDASFTVTGAVMPAGAVTVDFVGDLPINWTNSGLTHDKVNGTLSANSSSYYLTTPKLQFVSGDFIVVKAKRNDSDTIDKLYVYGSSDNGSTWTAYSKTITGADALTQDWANIVLSDIPTTVNKLRFACYYATIDDVTGLTYAPVLVVKDAEDAVQASPVAYAFGEQGANASVTYSFTNGGAGTLNITNVAVTNTPNDGTYTTNWTESVATPFNLVITQNYDAEKAGAKTGSVVVTMSDASTFTINLSGTLLAANAPTLSVSTNAINFGKVTANAVETVTVTNTGTGTMTVDIASDSEDFEVSAASLTGIGAGESKTFNITFKYGTPYGVKNGNVTVTPTYDVGAAQVITVTGKAKDPATWSEDFSGGTLPIGWESGANWTIAERKAKGTWASSASYLTTAPLTVGATTDELTFDYITTAGNVNINIQMSKDGGEWTTCTATPAIPTYMSNGTAGTAIITGLEAGTYQFRFKNDDYNLDNFEGFVLNLPDHMMAITTSSIPSSGLKEGQAFNATVDVKENRGVAETGVIAKLYMNSVVIGTSTATDFEANESKQITIPCTPTTGADDASMYIEVVYASGSETVSTTPVNRNVAAITNLTLDETSDDELVSGTYDNIILKRKFTKGWNTVCLPFTISDVEAFFGVGAKAYNLTSYSDGKLGFENIDELEATYPYVVYVPVAITEDIIINNINITINYANRTADYRHIGDAYFRGTYTPIAAGSWPAGAYGVTSDGKIAPGTSTSFMKGFRAYFTGITAGARLSFFDETTGITTVIDAKELNNDGKVYNLNGQRVENAHKGLYIVNGRKVVVK